jgi:hypothetical protein
MAASWRNLSKNPYARHFLQHQGRLSNPLKGDRTRPALWDISHGCILWLPRKQSIYLPKPQIDVPSTFDRPVLVLDLKVEDPENASITFLFLVTHRKELLRDPMLWTAQTDALTIDIKRLGPNAPDFRNETSLYLENFPKPPPDTTPYAFVNMRRKYTMEWQNFRCYDGHPDAFRYRLNKGSFLRLAKQVPDFKFSPSSRIPTDMLWAAFYEKHIKHRYTLGSRAAKASWVSEPKRWRVIENTTERV